VLLHMPMREPVMADTIFALCGPSQSTPIAPEPRPDAVLFQSLRSSPRQAFNTRDS
jgi:hypothetical protein